MKWKEVVRFYRRRSLVELLEKKVFPLLTKIASEDEKLDLRFIALVGEIGFLKTRLELIVNLSQEKGEIEGDNTYMFLLTRELSPLIHSIEKRAPMLNCPQAECGFSVAALRQESDRLMSWIETHREHLSVEENARVVRLRRDIW